MRAIAFCPFLHKCRNFLGTTLFTLFEGSAREARGILFNTPATTSSSFLPLVSVIESGNADQLSVSENPMFFCHFSLASQLN